MREREDRQSVCVSSVLNGLSKGWEAPGRQQASLVVGTWSQY